MKMAGKCSWFLPRNIKRNRLWTALGFLFFITLVLISFSYDALKKTFENPYELIENIRKSLKPAKDTEGLEKWIVDHIYFNYNYKKEEPIDTNQTCVLQQYHPFDKSIIKFVKAFPVNCRILQNAQFLTYVDDNGVLKYNETDIKLGKVDKKNLKCEYNEIVRNNESPIKDNYTNKKAKSFSESVDVSDIEFLEVNCYESGSRMYQNFHTNIPKNFPKKKKVNPKKYNVMIFGIDSLSRLNAMRQIPKPYNFMRDVLKGYIFRGQQKVWSNTFANVATMLTGYHPYQKPWPFPPNEKETKPHDPWPFVWKNYSNAGYRTMFAEDDPIYNAFHYVSGGFKAKPTDHYLRTFWTALEDSKLFSASTEYCFGNIPKHPLHIDYIRRLFDRVHGKENFFIFSWLTKICHGYLNSVGMANDDFYNFFKYINDKGYLKDTIVFFMSDHGQRFGEIRKTYLGSIEDKMPLCSLYLPDRFRKTQPKAVKNLEINVMRPTSVFDIYTTLIEIQRLSLNESYKIGQYKTKHGISLFGEIPQNRSCWAAGIDYSFCTCQEKIVIPVNKNVTKMAQFLVKEVNSLLLAEYHDFKLCSKLELKKVLNAVQFKSDAPKDRIAISFETSPSNATFEGTIATKDFSNLSLVGEIERTNRYGNQPWCIENKVLRVYCYCGPQK